MLLLARLTKRSHHKQLGTLAQWRRVAIVASGFLGIVTGCLFGNWDVGIYWLLLCEVLYFVKSV